MTEVNTEDKLFRNVIICADGTEFSTRAEAVEYLRKPQILDALNVLTDNNPNLSEWFYDNRDDVAGAFESGSVRRVTKSEHKQLAEGLEAVIAHVATVPDTSKTGGMGFVAEHAAVISACFKWPTVKKLTDTEKAASSRKAMLALTDNVEVVDWALANTQGLLAAFEAGKIKRVVSDAAAAGLTNYRMSMVAAKAVKECARLVNVAGVDADAIAAATVLATSAQAAADAWQIDADKAKANKEHVASTELSEQMGTLALAAREAYEVLDPDPKVEKERAKRKAEAQNA